jgi:hypothetical protein
MHKITLIAFLFLFAGNSYSKINIVDEVDFNLKSYSSNLAATLYAPGITFRKTIISDDKHEFLAELTFNYHLKIKNDGYSHFSDLSIPFKLRRFVHDKWFFDGGLLISLYPINS